MTAIDLLKLFIFSHNGFLLQGLSGVLIRNNWHMSIILGLLIVVVEYVTMDISSNKWILVGK